MINVSKSQLPPLTDVDPALVARLHDQLSDLDPVLLDRLHEQLVGAAARSGVLDLAYRTVDSPVGTLLVVATQLGMVRVAYEREDHDQVLATLSQRVSPRILRAPARLQSAARQIEEYFAGQRREFVLPLDLRLARGFRRQVLEHLGQIGYGQTESYTQVAGATGHPKAVRAVGSACATNSLPILVPCHRVLRSDGTLGGYVGGLNVKSALLDLESAG